MYSPSGPCLPTATCRERAAYQARLIASRGGQPGLIWVVSPSLRGLPVEREKNQTSGALRQSRRSRSRSIDRDRRFKPGYFRFSGYFRDSSQNRMRPGASPSANAARRLCHATRDTVASRLAHARRRRSPPRADRGDARVSPRGPGSGGARRRFSRETRREAGVATSGSGEKAHRP